MLFLSFFGLCFSADLGINPVSNVSGRDVTSYVGSSAATVTAVAGTVTAMSLAAKHFDELTQAQQKLLLQAIILGGSGAVLGYLTAEDDATKHRNLMIGLTAGVILALVLQYSQKEQE